ncbi:protein-glutamine gamma-glutamyltransferase TgpA [Marinobacterium maritimum]|uniref:Protein-glutamine gamma-glutamyltransferase TgpA n=1 Tax=Marinobacterium maritimum TaxID=500162 RepID=A0ABN1I4F5_9GAMM
MKGGMISRTAVVWQLLAVLLVVLPHLQWLPLWVPALVVVTIGARLMIHSGRWSFPHWLVKAMLVLACSVGLILSFNHQAGPETMVALLVVGLALKLLEIYHRRDALVVLFVTLFVAATAFLFNESVWMAAYVLLVVGLALAALNSIQQSSHANRYRDNLKTALRLLLPAIPFMLVLFFLFPRLEPFWSVTIDSGQGTTGLSDELSPGDVSKLAQSSELAFRATFAGDVPPPEQRYWRSLVLSEFDGRRWTRPAMQIRRQLRPEKLTPLSVAQNYDVIMEASRRPWLVALDQPVSAGRGVRMTPVRTLRADQPLERRRQYRVESVAEYQLQPLLTSQEKQRYLQLPLGGNPKSRTLARQLLVEGGGEASRVISLLLERFNRTFIYTLEPGYLGRDSVDQFLFETQQGYCEHFASATTFVLRSAGIPARVVTGYQGGEWNPYEGYLQVRQYDAHAWVEYWLPGHGWQRLDPTAAVAPERIRSSAQDFFRANESRFSGVGLGLNTGWLRNLRQRYDAFNYGWHRWVLNYQGQQANLLHDWLGGGEQWRKALAWLLPTALVFGLSFWWLIRPRGSRPKDPLQRLLMQLEQRLAALEAERFPAESLSMWLQRIAEHWPEQRALMLRLAFLDDRQRYSAQPKSGQRREMLQLCRQLLRLLPRRR